MVNLENFFRKYKGSYFGFAGCILGVIILTIATILYSLADPFNMFTHWISNLGIGPNGSNLVFNIGLLITSIIFIPFMVHVSRFLLAYSEKKLNDIIIFVEFIFSLLTLIGLILVACFPLNPETIILHLLGALLFFNCVMLFTIFYIISTLINKMFSKIQFLTGAIVVFVYIIFMISIFDTILANSRGSITFEQVQAFFRASGEPLLVRFFEWLYLFSFYAFILQMCFQTLKKE